MSQATYTVSAQTRKVQRILYRACRKRGIELDCWPFCIRGHWHAYRDGNCQRITDILNMRVVP